jgi:outer membrane protein insertion porin family
LKRTLQIHFSIILCLLFWVRPGDCRSSGAFMVKSIKFDGNSVADESQLLRCMLTQPSALLHKSKYIPQVLETDTQNLIDLYHEMGYWETAVSAPSVQIDSLKREVSIRIRIEEGFPTRIAMITVSGNTAWSDTQIVNRLPIRRGELLKQSSLQESRLKILRRYAEGGFVDAKADLELRINGETHEAFIRIPIQEGQRCQVGQILLLNLQKTKARVVLRELTFQKGDTVRYSKLLESQRKLYLTGLFESVFIRPADTLRQESKLRDILIELKEKKSGEFNLAIGYGSWEKFRARMELFNTNIAGSSRKLGVSLKGSFKYWGSELSFSEPWTFGTPLNTDAAIKVDQKEEPGYNIQSYGGRLTMGWHLSSSCQVSALYVHEISNLSHIRLGPLPDQLKTNIHSITLMAIRDTRDNLFNTTRGRYVEIRNELAGGFLKGTDTFIRSIVIGKAFFPLGSQTLIGSAIEVGWMGTFKLKREIPLNERFYTGDANMLRGFRYHTVGPMDQNKYPIGGRFKLALNLFECRFPLYKMVSGAGFMDIGNVWRDSASISLKNLRSTAGFGVRAATPLGIIRTDLGFNLDPRNGEPKTQWIFSMGQAF